MFVSESKLLLILIIFVSDEVGLCFLSFFRNMRKKRNILTIL
jgi:hypothetical protein